MAPRRFIVGGNWKMYKTPSEAATLAKALKVKLINVENVDVVICPPAIDLQAVANLIKESKIKLGGQNMYFESEGAFTGEISSAMLRDAGCEFVILGHSERRHVFGETDDVINKKVLKALDSGLRPIFCVGETLEQRNKGETNNIVENQVRTGLNDVKLNSASALIIAYEPVWAIGTGINATPEQAEEAHKFIRSILEDIFDDEMAAKLRIQYGGSVKAANATDLMGQDNIDGALVGGASLDPDSFTEIIKSAQKLTN